MVLIVWVLASSYFIWTLSENTVYNDAIRQKNQLESAVLSENVQVTNTTYVVVSNDNVTVSTAITNPSSLSVQFTTLWVYTSNTTYTGYNFTQLSNVNIQGGAYRSLSFNMTVGGLRLGGTYNFSSWLITARGNVVALQKQVSSKIIHSQTTQGIGALAMDFQSFTYYIVSGSTLTDFPTGASAYTVSSGGSNIAFRIILTNLDQGERDITLYSNSVFFSIFPTTPQQVRGSYWYIVNVNEATGAISSTYTPVILAFNKPTAIYFASDHAIKPGSPFNGAPARFTGTSPVNLALIGQIGGTPFGQNIPFVSIDVAS